MIARPSTSIARVAVRAERADLVATRLAVERVLGALDLRPRGLPPAAILCVRHLADPRPGTLVLDSRAARPPPAWMQAMERELDRLASAAARPAHDAVPAGAEAVVFADEAELLACLAGDVVSGLFAARWWWRLLVEGHAEPRRATVRAFLRAPEDVPAALDRLAERGQLAAFMEVLEETEVRALTAAVVEKFALTWLEPVVAAPVPPTARIVGAEAAAPSEPEAAPPAPWSAVVPEVEPSRLTVRRAILAGVALTVARAPAVARRRDFAVAVAAWRDGVEATPPAGSAGTVAPPAQALVSAGTPHTVSPPPAPPPVSPVEPAPAEPFRARATASVETARPSTPAPSVAETTSPTAPTPDDMAAVAATPAHAGPTGAEPPAMAPRWSPATPRKILSLRPRGRAFGPPIRTELGGLFYLVNLALYLRFYGGDDDLELPLWDFVALVGRALLGDGLAEADPIWPLLSELAGRAADEPPGTGFVPPGGLSLAEWLASILPAIRARLRSALRVDDEGLPAMLLAHRARVHVTDTHVDIVLSLATLPVEIRIAGLDRDPGWVAAAGRFLAFHFESDA